MVSSASPCQSSTHLSPVRHHGIPDAVIEAAIHGARRFFALPTPTKNKLDIHATPNFKGYTALLGENTNPDNKGRPA
ncbi:hypothetical protein JVU11DRAFT_3336 [Chiua virens]|nr:hypothetical protein JVU11DRAFT_3336 [Chiua virens]